MTPKVLRNLPSVSELLESQPLRGLVDRLSHSVVVAGVRTTLDEIRREVRTAAGEVKLPDVRELAERIARRIAEDERPSLRPVINATGILLHTGLGRAPLCEAALEQLVAVGRNYASVELDLSTGERSRRVDAVEPLLRRLTGAEAAVVVNNNAAATLLTLTALAAGREVVVSRGQLVEIGGSFRLPDVMSASGAVLREVGTTNKTRLADYAAAIGPQTAALLRVHTSNFAVVGFTEAASLEELVRLGQQRGLPVIDDIGSGALVDFAQFGFPAEPVAAHSLRAGADVALFSGDKLLGGPQCGVIVGRREPLERIGKHPLMRALRVDKLTLAALAATLRELDDPARAQRTVPLLQLLTTTLDNLRNRAERLAAQLAANPALVRAEAIADETFLGGGSAPTERLRTWCVSLEPAGRSVDDLAGALRAGQPAIVGRIQRGRLLLDLRTVFARQDQEIAEACGKLSA
jgi:L-seryl-tRNA(Ser) seleniumtransferase